MGPKLYGLYPGQAIPPGGTSVWHNGKQYVVLDSDDTEYLPYTQAQIPSAEMLALNLKIERLEKLVEKLIEDGERHHDEIDQALRLAVDP